MFIWFFPSSYVKHFYNIIIEKHTITWWHEWAKKSSCWAILSLPPIYSTLSISKFYAVANVYIEVRRSVQHCCSAYQSTTTLLQPTTRHVTEKFKRALLWLRKKCNVIICSHHHYSLLHTRVQRHRQNNKLNTG